MLDRAFIQLVCFFLLASGSLELSARAEEGMTGLIELYATDLAALSRGSLKYRIDEKHHLVLQGNWPSLCGRAAKAGFKRDSSGFHAIIFATKECVDLLSLSSDAFKKLPKVSLADIHFVGGTVEKNEMINIGKIKRTLNLNLDQTITFDMTEGEKGLGGKQIGLNGGEGIKIRQKPERIGAKLGYQPCDPSLYDHANSTICQGKVGLHSSMMYKMNRGVEISVNANTIFKAPGSNGQGSFFDASGGLNVRVPFGEGTGNQ